MLPVFGTVLWPIRRNLLRWSAIAVVIGLGQSSDMTPMSSAHLPVHEISLHKAGLLSWVLSTARIGLIGQNKEGLVSLPGRSYWQGDELTDRLRRYLLHRPVDG
jgi:hypothetical protein